MSIEKVRGDSLCPKTPSDPRHRILKEHYFSIRPAPLEEWLWDQNLPPSAERVFWLHWREGHRRGDFCSEIPLSVVARRCRLNISSVTRAYQKLELLGCLRRINPGRNPANPFCQATALTEVFVPKTLLTALPRHPRRAATGHATASRQSMPSPHTQTPLASEPTTLSPTQTGPASLETSLPPSAAPEQNNSPTAATCPITTDPLAGLTGRQRMATMSRWRDAMSEAERRNFDGAFREHHPTMIFDAACRLSSQDQAQVLDLLRYLAKHPASGAKSASPTPSVKPIPPRRTALRISESARLRGQLAKARGVGPTDELLRQITWSIEKGNLAKYPVPKAIAIALKKVREGAWSRPHRMPPNWWPALPSTSYAARHN